MAKRKRDGQAAGRPSTQANSHCVPPLDSRPTRSAPAMTPYHLAIDFEQWEKCKTHQCEHHAPRNFPWGHILQPQLYDAQNGTTAELQKLQATIKTLRREDEMIREDLEEYNRVFEVEERLATVQTIEVDMQDVEQDFVDDEDEEEEGSGSEEVVGTDSEESEEEEEEVGEESVAEDGDTDAESDEEETEHEPLQSENIGVNVVEVLHEQDDRKMDIGQTPEKELKFPGPVNEQRHTNQGLQTTQQDIEVADEVYDSAAEEAMEYDRPLDVPPVALDQKVTESIDTRLVDAEAAMTEMATVPHGLPMIPMLAPPAEPAVNRVFVVIFRTVREEGDDLCELKGAFTSIVSANEAAHSVLRRLVPYLEDDEIYDKPPSDLLWPNASHLGMPERRYTSDGEIRLSVDHKDLGMTFVSVVRQALDVMPVESSQDDSAVIDQNQIPTRPEHPWDWPTDWQSTGVSTFGYEG
ncbi:hypothetical protein LTR86_009579 [Recurvomyces mirabilis]|nr:hypothetical protein LTR86_009579 [Recurvomyces mirabilis]